METMAGQHHTSTPDSMPEMPADSDFSTCDRELVQFIPAILPHGALLVIAMPTCTVLQASANTLALCGVAPEAVLGAAVETVIARADWHGLAHGLAQLSSEALPVYLGRVRTRNGTPVDAFAHCSAGQIVLELESLSPDFALAVPDLYKEVKRCTERLQAAPSVQACLEAAVQEIRRLTGFDAVLGFEFFDDGSGRVLAETREASFPSFLDKHFPAADVPAPARRQMQLVTLQHLPAVDYEPVPLLPAHNPHSDQPVDLSCALLRSVSRMCSRYYHNMGAGAKLLLSLTSNGTLWGFISCLHRQPRHLPYEVRMACESLAHLVSLTIATRADMVQHTRARETRQRVDQLVEFMMQEPVVHLGLVRHEPNLHTCLEADGAAILVGQGVTLLGQTPAEADVLALGRWLHAQDNVYATHRLPSLYPPAQAFQAQASGLLAVRLGTAHDYLLWFRQERIREVRWAGDPRKPMEVDAAHGEVRLTPRRSFELWQETVYGTARPWTDVEIEAATALGRAVLLLQHSDALARTNIQLTRSNEELESFAYSAAHDLKEPLRGIRNFSAMLEDSIRESLGTEDQARLATIMRLSARMDTLLEALLQYARVGRLDLHRSNSDLNQVLQTVLDSLQLQLGAAAATVVIPRPLPVVQCDPVRVAEVLSNLLSNAIKYNDKAAKNIEIGYQDGTPPVFYVRDNGIGLEPEYFETIFQLFRRLHGREAYGGGAGAGLTIVRQIIARHGGRIWVESTLDAGTTFFFTLAAEEFSEQLEEHGH